MIEEYARHNGHADLLRERVDGIAEHWGVPDRSARLAQAAHAGPAGLSPANHGSQDSSCWSSVPIGVPHPVTAS